VGTNLPSFGTVNERQVSPVPERFPDSLQRILRADVLQQLSIEAWDKFSGDDAAYQPVVEINNQGRGVIGVILRHDSLPPLFSLQLGEMLYQLRAALDSLIYSAAIYELRERASPFSGAARISSLQNKRCFSKERQ
jgi:hypothetical protein